MLNELLPWGLLVVLAMIGAIIGSQWICGRQSPAAGRLFNGFLAVILLFPAALYLENRILGWQIAAPGLIVTLIILLAIGFGLSKNMPNVFRK